MKVDTTFKLLEMVVADTVDADEEEVEMDAATFSTDDNCGFICAGDIDVDVGDEFGATFKDDGDLFSFSFDVVSLFEIDDEMILFCRFLVILAN